MKIYIMSASAIHGHAEAGKVDDSSTGKEASAP